MNIKDQQKCMVHFEGKGMFPKVHWRILEDDSGRFLARIPRGLGLLKGSYNIGIWKHTFILTISLSRNIS